MLSEKEIFRDVPVYLIGTFLLLLPFGRLAEIPIGIMAALGLVILVSRPQILRHPVSRNFTLLFALFWLPIVLSLIGAVNFERTLSVAFSFIRLWLMGLYISVTISENIVRQRFLLKIFSFLLAFWVVDALFQFAVGFNSFGFRSDPQALNGLFGEDHPKLGVYLAVFSPILFVYAYRNWSPLFHVLTILSASTVVFLAGRRGGWIMLAVVLVGFSGWLIWGERKKILRWIAIAGLLICLSVSTLYLFFPSFTERVDQSMMIFSGDRDAIDMAISYRLPIWTTAVRMIEENYFNGVGARGFRYAYRDYADKGDIFIADEKSLGATYAHQMILDVLSETGIVGILCLSIACGFIIVLWKKSSDYSKKMSIAYFLSLLAIFFPLNTHYATYSSIWSSVILFMICLFCSATELKNQA